MSCSFFWRKKKCHVLISWSYFDRGVYSRFFDK